MLIGLDLGIARPRGAGGGSSLLSGLVSYWKLDEVSGTRVDSLGTYNLIDNNTVGSAAAKIALGADFVSANVESLSNATIGAPFDFQDTAFTIAGWYSADDQSANHVIIAKDNLSQRSWVLLYGTSAQLNFSVFPGPTAVMQSGLVGDGTLHFFVAWHDPAADTVNLQVDNGTVISTAKVGGATSSTAALVLGAFSDGTSAAHDGKIDELGTWQRVLTAAERTVLYNGGAGLTYPFTGS